MTPQPKKYFSTREVAELFGVTQRTIRRWARALNIGHQFAFDCDWHFTEEDVQQMQKRAA